MPTPGQTSPARPPQGVFPSETLAAWPGYVIDAFQRRVLFLDLLRRRGDEQIEIEARPTSTLLSFGHETLMSGHSLPRPINYSLLRIDAPAGVATDPRKRPVVVVDPRAGQGPGIGGFKTESEVGDALRAGHPVYFIAFSATPEPGQQFLDVVEGQAKFMAHVVDLHPDAARPFAIGNCQAGYQTLMAAMLRPDLFGPCLVVGSPMSFWQGVRGRNPLRYSGGLLGGGWLTALTSDVGMGRFDGTGLILNFDNLGPANWLWGKQYEVYAAIDSGAERYLEFEKWWGDFIQLNGDELQYLVDNLFIGDKLDRNELRSTEGVTFDVRNITSPIIVFTSMGDNISPPQQTLGWIPDLYRDVEEIRADGRTIIYCLDQKIGHLALFVSSKVGAVQDEQFVQMMDVVDCLPPGLYEMIISPQSVDETPVGFAPDGWTTRFETRTLDDVLAVGRNSPADDRAFAAVARLSALNLSTYRAFMQPVVRALANHPAADLARSLDPMRLSYTAFASRNPWMGGVQTLATAVTAARRPTAADNPWLARQTQVSDQIVAALDTYQIARDQWIERTFFGIFGSPIVQAMLGMDATTEVRPTAAISPERLASRRDRTHASEALVTTGGFDEAFTRALLYVLGTDQTIDPHCALALNLARTRLAHLSLAQFKAMARDQLVALQGQPERAVAALAGLVGDAETRKDLLGQVQAILGAIGGSDAAASARLADLVQVMKPPTPRRTDAAEPADAVAPHEPRVFEAPTAAH